MLRRRFNPTRLGKVAGVVCSVSRIRHTRPILEAFAHARFMVEMAVHYADLPEPPQPMPSG